MHNAYRRAPEWGAPNSWVPSEGKKYKVWFDRYLQSNFGKERAENLRRLLERNTADSHRAWETTFLESIAAIVPSRIANEDVADFIEDIVRRASAGEHPLLTSARIAVAAFWAVVNSIMYFFRKPTRGKSA